MGLFGSYGIVLSSKLYGGDRLGINRWVYSAHGGLETPAEKVEKLIFLDRDNMSSDVWRVCEVATEGSNLGVGRAEPGAAYPPVKRPERSGVSFSSPKIILPP